jgi:pilus assembly protein CpaB
MAFTVAVLLGLLSAFLVYSYIKKKEAAANQGQNVISVVASKRPIRKNDVISDIDTFFVERRVRAVDAPKGWIPWNDVEMFVGRRIYETVPRGMLVLSSYFLPTDRSREERSELNIPKGMRAITLAVDQITGVGGLLKPRNRVDVLLVTENTFAAGGARGAAAEELISATLLSNVGVWAVDSRTAAMPPSRAAGGRRNYSAITLLVTQEEAELLAMGQKVGTLILTQRRSIDNTARSYTPKEFPAIQLSTMLESGRRLNALRQGRLKTELEQHRTSEGSK